MSATAVESAKRLWSDRPFATAPASWRRRGERGRGPESRHESLRTPIEADRRPTLRSSCAAPSLPARGRRRRGRRDRPRAGLRRLQAGRAAAASTSTRRSRASRDAPPPLAALHAQHSQLLDGGTEAFEARLEELRGFPVVVNKWGSWCSPCRAGVPALPARRPRDYGQAVAFLGIDGGDNEDEAQEFLERDPGPFPSYFDPRGTVSQDAGVPGGAPDHRLRRRRRQGRLHPPGPVPDRTPTWRTTSSATCVPELRVDPLTGPAGDHGGRRRLGADTGRPLHRVPDHIVDGGASSGGPEAWRERDARARRTPPCLHVAAARTLRRPTSTRSTSSPPRSPASASASRAYAVRTMGGNLLGDLVQEEVRRRERIVAVDDEAVVFAPYASRVPYQLMLAPRTVRGALRGRRAAGRRAAADVGRAPRTARSTCGSAPRRAAPSTSAGGSTSSRRAEVGRLERGTGLHVNPVAPGGRRRGAAATRESAGAAGARGVGDGRRRAGGRDRAGAARAARRHPRRRRGGRRPARRQGPRAARVRRRRRPDERAARARPRGARRLPVHALRRRAQGQPAELRRRRAARPRRAPLRALRATASTPQRGVFGAHMEVALVNDGPVTLLLET